MPDVVVECGAGHDAPNTKNLLELQKALGYELFTIDDNPYHEEKYGLDILSRNNFEWIQGVSFLELEKFPNESIDICLIDTDHNYWTLNQELTVLYPRLSLGGLIILHDTETYWNDSGTMGGYRVNIKYPQGIHDEEQAGKKMGDAVTEFLHNHLDCHIIAESKESHGAMAIQKEGE